MLIITSDSALANDLLALLRMFKQTVCRGEITMSKTSKPVWETESQWFPSTLRGFIQSHPQTGKVTTQKVLADYLEVRPQTLSLYCNGQTQPTPAKLLKIAEYFGVTADFLLTGKRTENKPVREMLGLSEDTVQALKLVKEGYWEDSPHMLSILDSLLMEKDFYNALAKCDEAYTKSAQSQVPQCPDCGGSLSLYVGDEVSEFHEWKAANFLHSFLIEFFRRRFYREETEEGGD